MLFKRYTVAAYAFCGVLRAQSLIIYAVEVIAVSTSCGADGNGYTAITLCLGERYLHILDSADIRESLLSD